MATEQITEAGNGAAPAEPGTITVSNPATAEVISAVPDLGAAAVAQMFEAARAAQPAWDAIGFRARADLITDFRRWMMAEAERMIETIMAETGKTFEDAMFADLFYTAEACRFWAKKGEKMLADRRVRPRSAFAIGKRLTVRYRPRGAIGVIGPWNYPLANSVGDCIPALLAGNTVVLKPSELTPMSSLLVAEGFEAVGFPEGVFQVATGAGETGGAVVDEADMVMFTGSTATGRRVMERAAKSLTPVSLELGGKDPMIVLRDADLERAANAAVYYAMLNGGQTCISVERVYVEEPVYDEFVAKVTERVRELRQGDPAAGPGTVEVGAVTMPRQKEIISGHVADALARGARALTGGKGSEAGGDFYEPTVLVDVDHEMECMTEETFGPTLPIMKVCDAEEALRLANDTPYGLGASVFGGNADRAERIARRVEAGSVAVNDPLAYYAILDVPMGGWKTSGIGVRHGPEGIRKYCLSQTILTSPRPLRREPHWFGYGPRKSRFMLRLLKRVYGR